MRLQTRVALQLTLSFAGRPAPTVSHQLLGGVQGPCPPEGRQAVCRVRSPLWTTGRVRRRCHQGASCPSFRPGRRRWSLYLSACQPEPKSSAKLLKSLSSHYSFLTSKSDPSRRPGAKKASVGMDDLGGEFASVMEEEYLSFVCMEVPIVN